MSVTRCARCGSDAPQFKPFDYNDIDPNDSSPRTIGGADDLLKVNPSLIDNEAPCMCCIGMSMGEIIDRAWDLSKVPTDALMRQLARRFL